MIIGLLNFARLAHRAAAAHELAGVDRVFVAIDAAHIAHLVRPRRVAQRTVRVQAADQSRVAVEPRRIKSAASNHIVRGARPSRRVGRTPSPRPQVVRGLAGLDV